jgi:hypothetical protein
MHYYGSQHSPQAFVLSVLFLQCLRANFTPHLLNSGQKYSSSDWKLTPMSYVSSFYQLKYAQSSYVTLIRLLNVLADVMAGKFHVSKTKNFQCGKMYEPYSYYSMHNFAPYL